MCIRDRYDTHAIWDENHHKNPQLNAQGEFVRVKTGQKPIEVSMTVVLESLIGVDEVNFFFEVQFLLVMSWNDERINKVCQGAGRGGQLIHNDDRCGHYWQPQMPPTFPNQLALNGNEPIEVLEDLGLFTYPGRRRGASPFLPCASRGHPAHHPHHFPLLKQALTMPTASALSPRPSCRTFAARSSMSRWLTV